jgi:hypothetical protein
MEELLKLGIEISQATVAKYMVRRHKPPSQTWRTFLGESHSADSSNRLSGSKDRELSLAVRICCPESLAATRDSLQRDGAPHRRMDGKANRGSVSVG